MAQTAAIIDLGSNTSRLVVYEFEPGRRFRLVDEVREVVRLREGMGSSQTLRAAAIDRALHALHMFRSLCDASSVTEVVAAGTSAVRDARNRDSFVARVRVETGLTLRLLSGEEEAYYGALGAINGTGLREGFVIDMGGGSVQVTEVRRGLPGRCVSLPLGALHVTETFLSADRLRPAEVKEFLKLVHRQLAPLDWFSPAPGDMLVAIGGTVRNLARLQQAAEGYPLENVHGYRLGAAQLHELADRLWRLSPEERRELPGLQADRADIIHGGALVYSALLRHSGFDALTVSRMGLREGLFHERFLADQREPVIEDIRCFSVLNLARNFGYDTPHAHHVAALSLLLFDQLQPLHGLPAHYRQLLWAAGILHDIGIAVSYYSHHEHSSYIILNSILPGYTPREQALISLLARYHRSRGMPRAGVLDPLLEQADRDALDVLAGILRLCEFFERGRQQVIRDIRCHIEREGRWLQIEALAAGDASVALWEAQRNMGLLADALGMEIEIVGGVWRGADPA